MDTKDEIKLRGPALKLFQFIGMLAEREKFPIRLQPIEESSFVFFTPYQLLADTVFQTVKDKHPEVTIKAVKNKIVFYVKKEDLQVVRRDIEDVAKSIYNKFKVRIGIEVTDENGVLIIAKAEPFAVFMIELILKEVKKKNQDVIRLFKFLKGEIDVNGYGWSLVVGVKYIYSSYDKLEEMVG